MRNKPKIRTYKTMRGLINRLRGDISNQDFVLLFAYNGTGKTRLSMEFKERGKKKNNGNPDTLYFNAFTEDLFHWDNDLENDSERKLTLNKYSKFFEGLKESEMDTRIRRFLQRYADFDFRIDYEDWTVSFSREDTSDIKISRGEENMFIWCFFLAITQLAIDGQEAYKWVKNIYIDDPISSLDDNNAIAVASHLVRLLNSPDNKIKTVISSHHTLFFNVICNELKKKKGKKQYFLHRDRETNIYSLQSTDDTPQFYHVAMLKELQKAAESGDLYTYHFNILRNLLEKTATFHGFSNFSDCIKQKDDDVDGVVHARIINLLSHGNYSLFEPIEMLEENKEYFCNILRDFMGNYQFNPDIFP